MSHYDEFYYKEDSSEDSAAQWLDYDYSTTDNLQEIKETKGKPSGARYCFIPALDINFSLGAKFEALVDGIDTNLLKTDILKLVNNVKKSILETNNNPFTIINNLIILRDQSLKSGKYREKGYKSKIAVDLLLDAFARHYIKYALGIEVDEDSKCLHLSHMLANILMIGYQIEVYYDEAKKKS